MTRLNVIDSRRSVVVRGGVVGSDGCGGGGQVLQATDIANAVDPVAHRLVGVGG